MARLAQIRQRVEHWRRTRARRGRMPEDLWRAAVALAREHGVYGKARGLSVNYDSLKARVPVQAPGQKIQAVVRGYFAYHAVPTNMHSLASFRIEVLRAWRHPLTATGPALASDLATIKPAGATMASYTACAPSISLRLLR